MKKKKVIAVFSASAGAGHIRAAEALRVTAEEEFDNIELVHIDVMTLVPTLFRKIFSDSYVKVVEKTPSVWGHIYNLSDKVEDDHSPMKKLRVAVEQLNTKKFREKIKEIQPDAIICTHFLPAELISKLKKKGKCDIPCWVQVTDFDLHGLWVQNRMDGYFAASEEVAFRMKERGIPEESIHITGIPVMPVFKKIYSRKECAAELGVNSDKKTVLMMSGGCGIGGIEKVAGKLAEIDKDVQIIALAGKSKKLLAKLEKLAEKYPGRIIPMGYTNEIEKVMSVSDVAVTKPGGLTTSECLALGLPMIAMSPIPGQEERNADYLLENGAGLKACCNASLEYRIRKVLKDETILRELKANSERISTPEAASDILRVVTTARQRLVA